MLFLIPALLASPLKLSVEIPDWNVCTSDSHCASDNFVCCVGPADISTGEKKCRPQKDCSRGGKMQHLMNGNRLPQKLFMPYWLADAADYYTGRPWNIVEAMRETGMDSITVAFANYDQKNDRMVISNNFNNEM